MREQPHGAIVFRQLSAGAARRRHRRLLRDEVADPYRWMEDLNSPELKQWVDAENALAFAYLNALPQRDALKARITELSNYAKVTPPRYEGDRWFER